MNISIDSGIGQIVLYIVIAYLILINIYAVLITVIDKNRARKNSDRRISERTFFTTASLGGSVAMYITMLIIRHKTKHVQFKVGIPLIIIVQILVVAFAFFALR